MKIKKIKRYSKVKDTFKDIAKNLIKKVIAVFIIFGCVLAIFSLAEAMDGSNPIVDDSPIDENSNSNDSTKTDLTSQQIDKIISDLKNSGNIDNILKKLDEIANRAELSGNAALKEYALEMKASYELQKQLESSKSMIDAMKKKNPEISKVDEQVSKILSVTTIIEDLRGAVSDETLVILESLTQDQLKDLQELLAEIENIFDLKDISSMSIRDRALLDLLFLKEIKDKQMLKKSTERLELMEDTLSVAITILKSYELQDYPPSIYMAMSDSSEKFRTSGKKTQSIMPEQVVFFNGPFKLKDTPIGYDGHILASIDSLFQYIGNTKIDYIFGSANMVIQSDNIDNNKILEISAGKNTAYLDDVPMIMPVPILNFNNKIYMSVESFAKFYNISYRVIPEHNFVILFHNLTQLKNTSVPNQLNKG